jgi:hypothetical protein
MGYSFKATAWGDPLGHAVFVIDSSQSVVAGFKQTVLDPGQAWATLPLAATL